MPIYFFHVTEGDAYFDDPEGVERVDLAAVERTATKGISDLIADAVKKGIRDYRGRLDVEDEHGRRVLAFSFTCPIQVEMTAP